MTDSWERRAIANTPGYNNIGSALTFVPVYNDGPDELVITASHPVFGPVDTINYAGTNGSGQLYVGTHFTVDSPTQITVFSAGPNLNAPTDLTQLDFFSAGPILVGTWTGLLSIQSTVLPIVTSAVGAGAGRIVIFGSGFVTNDFGPVDRAVIVFDDTSFVNFYSTTGPNAGLNPPGTSGFTLPSLPDSDSGFEITNVAELSGKTVDQIGVQDFLGNYFIYYDIANVVIP